MTTVERIERAIPIRNLRVRPLNVTMYLLDFLAIILLLTAVLPLLPVDWWWVRAWDFPRLQLLVLYLLAAAGLGFFWTSGVMPKVFVPLLIGASVYQVSWIYPYLPVAAQETEMARDAAADNRIRLVTINVLQTNRESAKLLELVDHTNPDVLVLSEVDHWWIDQVKPLERTFAHSVTYPLENGYGIALYSRLPVKSADVRFLIQPDIPSIDATVELPNGTDVKLFAVHPMPPKPGQDTNERDAELIVVGRTVKQLDMPSVVLGDMNDVGWSETTRLFQKISGHLDPRKGRGMYATYNAFYPGLRYPLDHLFHSDHFRLVKLDVLPAIGSDHFPLLVDLSFEPEARRTQEAPPAKPEDHEAADEAVREARG